MKYFCAMCAAAIVMTLAGCTRGEPVTDTVITPPSITTLQPVAVIDLSTVMLEPSGIFYNVKDNALMVVSDERPEIFELRLDGTLLKKIMTNGSDLEGITMNATCDTITVVQETRQLVTSYLLDGTEIKSFPVNVATNPKNALEGIAMDANGHLFVLNENTPRLLIEFDRSAKEIGRLTISSSLDLSDVWYDQQSDCFWIVSDESKKVYTINRSGVVLSQWLIPFVKGEGITIANGKMYIVNDADAKMYVFQKP